LARAVECQADVVERDGFHVSIARFFGEGQRAAEVLERFVVKTRLYEGDAEVAGGQGQATREIQPLVQRHGLAVIA